MCGGLGRATTEQGTAPRPKGRWNIQFLKLLLLPNALPALHPPTPPRPTKQAKFPVPEIILELVSCSPGSSWLPTSLLLSNLLSLLWCLCFSL